MIKLYKSFLKEYQSAPFGYATISILGNSCFGSIAAMAILMNANAIARPYQMIQLFLVTICCLGFNGAVLSGQKVKIQVNILLTSIFICFIFLASNLG